MGSSKLRLVTTPNVLDVIKLGVIFVVTEYDKEWNDYLTYVSYVNEPELLSMDVAFTVEDAVKQHRKCCLYVGIRPEEIAVWNE